MLEFILAVLVVFLVFGFFGLAIGWWTLAAAALLVYLSNVMAFSAVTNVVIGYAGADRGHHAGEIHTGLRQVPLEAGEPSHGK